HVGEARDRDSDAADLAAGERRVRVEADLRREVERDGEPRLPALEEVAVALVRLLGRLEPRVLAHGPELVAVHRRVNAARERELPGLADRGVVMREEVLRHVLRAI